MPPNSQIWFVSTGNLDPTAAVYLFQFLRRYCPSRTKNSLELCVAVACPILLSVILADRHHDGPAFG